MIGKCIRKIQDAFYEFAKSGSGEGINTGLEYLGNEGDSENPLPPHGKMKADFAFQANNNFSSVQFNVVMADHAKSISEDKDLPEGVMFQISAKKMQMPDISL